MSQAATLYRSVLLHRASIAAFALFATLVSAVWIENDAYRFGTLLLLPWGLYLNHRSSPRVALGWMGALCTAWALFVMARFLQEYAVDPTNAGASEGIYVVPLFYMALGYTFLLFFRNFRPGIVLFHVVSLAAALATVDFIHAFDGTHHEFLFMKNTIHSSVGGGLIVLASINFVAYLNRTIESARKRTLFCGLLYINLALYFVGIFGAQSKGVWIALAIAILAQVLISAPHSLRSGRFATAMLASACLGLALWALRDEIWATIGPSYDSLAALLIHAFRSGHPMGALREAIASGAVPENVNIRLMLWYNCLEVINHNILIGNGIGWLSMYKNAYYQNVGFDIVHNGYLEIAMRYGLLGLAFYAALYCWTIVMVYRAQRRGLIPVEAFHFHVVALVFFFATIATNSNNRIAIGESFMLVTAAFGFCCYFLVQRHARHGEAALPGDQPGEPGRPAA